MEVNRYFDNSVISTFSYWIIILISSLLLPPKEDIFCPWLKIGSQFVPPALTKPLLITNSKFSKSWDLFFFCFVSWNATVIGKISPRPPPSQLHPKIKILHNFEGKLKILHNLGYGHLTQKKQRVKIKKLVWLYLLLLSQSESTLRANLLIWKDWMKSNFHELSFIHKFFNLYMKIYGEIYYCFVNSNLEICWRFWGGTL